MGYNRSIVFIVVMVHIWKLNKFFTLSIFNIVVVLVTKACLTLCSPMDCSPPGSLVHGKFSRQKYWSGLSFPTPGFFQLWDQSHISWIGRWILYKWATWKAHFQCIIHINWASLMGSAHTESPCKVGDLGLIPGLRRSPEEGKWYPLQYCSLENSMECTAHWVAKSWIFIEFLLYARHCTKCFR